MTIRRSLFCGSLLLAMMLGLSACTIKRTASGERICFTGTTAYERKLRTLALTEARARERMADYVRAPQGESGPFFIGDHVVIVARRWPPRSRPSKEVH